MKFKVDTKGLWSVLDPEPGGKVKKVCVTCNMHERRSRGNRCKKCPFNFKSTEPENGSKVGMGAKFKPFIKVYTGAVNSDGSREVRDCTLDDIVEIGKCQFFYFMYHPELEWEFPPLPDMDSLGNIRKGSELAKTCKDKKKLKTFMDTIHHNNTIWHDDRYFNLTHTINTEHGSIHGEINRKNRHLELIHENKVKEILK